MRRRTNPVGRDAATGAKPLSRLLARVAPRAARFYPELQSQGGGTQAP